MTRRARLNLPPIACTLAAALAALASAAPPGAAGAADGSSASAEAQPVSFGRDVMAVFAKAGCNAGVCHGNAHGKGGFKLSLRGQDPAADYADLTRGQFARRIDRLDPDASLILRKPTTRVAHQGGKRFAVDSPEYRVLRRWIAAGLPAPAPGDARVSRLLVAPADQVIVEPTDRVQLRATATFSDGTSRDVTRWAVFEPSNLMVEVTPAGLVTRKQPTETTVIVRYLNAQAPVTLAFIPDRPDFTWHAVSPASYIDEHVFAKLRRLRMNPAPLCGDSVFVRRVYLDIIGLPPTAAEARAFVADASPDKRARLIDGLLARPEFADCWALQWADVLRNEENVLDETGVERFHAWIRRAIADGKPLDRFVYEILCARGSTYDNPPANLYRALRDPLTRAESVAQIFLGTRIACARCHNHPFDRWTQDDYYGFAALFARIDYQIVENKRKDENDKMQFIGEQVVKVKPDGEVNDPRPRKGTAKPRFLGESDAIPGDEDRLTALASWLTDASNDRFARAQVNRIWAHMMGRGVVEPVDDFRATNPPVNPALLDALTRDFIDSGFDLRHMVRRIANSATYQLASTPSDTNAADEINFSHAVPRRLTAEQLLDAIHQVVDVPTRFNGYPSGLRAGQLPGVNKVYRDKDPSPDDAFLKTFGKPPRLLTCECERPPTLDLRQVFTLTSGPVLADLLGDKNNRLTRLLASDQPNAAVIDELFWVALSRPPTDAEAGKLADYLNKADDRRAAVEDITWGLINAKEFVLRR